MLTTPGEAVITLFAVCNNTDFSCSVQHGTFEMAE